MTGAADHGGFFHSGNSGISGMAGVLCSNQADKDKKRSGIYRWLLAFRNDIFTESADQGSTVWMV